MVKTLNSRIRGALYGLFIGDALAMPVHWYYDRDTLSRDYVCIPRKTDTDSTAIRIRIPF